MTPYLLLLDHNEDVTGLAPVNPPLIELVS
jgi:hypothetical protein